MPHLRVLALSLCLAGCATIPRQSVDLSESIGSGLERSRAAHLATLGAFHERLAADNDEWVQTVFVPRLIANAQERMATACSAAGDTSADCARLSTDDFTVLLEEAMKFRDELQSALEKNYRASAQSIGRHYASLIRANEGLSAMLRSAVDVNEATREAAGSVEGATGIDIDTDAIQQAFSDFLRRAGETGADISELEETLEAIRTRLNRTPPSPPTGSER